MFSLKDKSAFITGAGSGIGQAVALTLAKKGARIYVADLSLDSALDTVQKIKTLGAEATAIHLNVADQKAVAQSFQNIKDLHMLINCAGISHIGNAVNTSEEDFDRIYQVNIKGTYNCLQAAIPILKNNGGGVIINISSIAAKVGLVDRFAYSMSKGAVHAMTLSVAKDFINDGIRCNSISPARVHTPFVDGFIAKTYPGKEAEVFDKLSKSQPIGRMGKPEEMAALVLYLCSDEASFITGSDFPIDGGFVTLNN